MLPISSYFLLLAIVFLPSNNEVARAMVLLTIGFVYALFAGTIVWLIVNLIAKLLSINEIKNLTNIIFILFCAYNLVGEKDIADILIYIIFMVVNALIILYFFKKTEIS